MKKILFAFMAVLCFLSGKSQAGAEARQVGSFHGVEVSGGIDLYLSSGREAVSVTAANDEIRNHIVTEVEGGILRIHLENNWNTGVSNPKMKAYVSIASLTSLEASGGGDIYIRDEITTTKLEVRLSGGGNLQGKLNADQLVIKQSGGSNVDLTGNVKDLSVDASGGGNLKGYNLVTDYTSIHSSGGCNAEITVNKELRVVSSGGSDVSYRGAASVREIKTSGGGSVTHKD